MKKVVEIERLRALAIGIVLLSHLGDVGILMPPWFRQGWPGVDLFFVISGFVVTRSLLRLLPGFGPHQSLAARLRVAASAIGTFLSRRFYRIVPMAVLWIAIPLALAYFYNSTGVMGELPRLFPESLAALSMTMDFFTAYFPGERLGHYWSLSVEEQFYLLLPLLLVVFSSRRRRIGAAAIGIALIAMVLRPFFPPEFPVQSYHLPYLKFDALLAGTLLALIGSRPIPDRLRWLSLPVVLITVGGLWCGPNLFDFDTLAGGGLAMGWLLSLVLVYLASLDRGWVLELPAIGRFLQHVGARSYGLYLIHRPLQNVLLESMVRLGLWPGTTIRSHPWAFLAVYGILLLALAELCYRGIEQPLIRFGRRRDSAELVPRFPHPLGLEPA